MKNLKTAAKIAVGFGLVIALMLALGALIYLNMIGVQGDTQRLDKETVPQLAAAASITRSTQLAAASMQGYALTLGQDYYNNLGQYLGDAGKAITAADALAQKYPRLFVLRKNTSDARDKLKELNDISEETNLTARAILAARGSVEVATQSFTKLSNAFLTSQSQKLTAAVRRGAGPVEVTRYAARIEAMHELADMVDALSVAVFKSAAVNDPTILENGIDAFDPFNDKLAALQKMTDGADKDTLDQLAFPGQDFLSACKDALAGMQKLATLAASSTSASQAVLAAATQTEDEGMKDARSITGLTVSRLLTADIFMAAGLAAAVLLGIAVALSISRAITRPLNRTLAFARTVAGGDFSASLDISQKDEIGALAEALNGMALKLRTAIATVQKNATAVAESSDQISASALKLSDGAQSQASTLEQTSASVEELSASVDQVSEHSKSQAAAVEKGTASMAQVHGSIELVSKNLNEISTLATRSVENAQEGARAVSDVADGIALIAASSEKIGGIVTVIADIADQTNLLALNASIEAARAGEHGRGFAVVAEEVSKLAERSSSSTKEIGTLIRESIKDVTKGVEKARRSQAAMEMIRAASQKVNEMIAGLSESISLQVRSVNEMAASLSSISEMSLNITAATAEQTANARQVSIAVEDVNEVAQNAATAAQEMSKSTEALAAMAQELQKLTGQFRIEAEDSEPGDAGDGIALNGKPAGVLPAAAPGPAPATPAASGPKAALPGRTTVPRP
ncbi:MAG TPA: methyl-accepting chemotaxis protein [Spirochaetia bacterium]|nr:methyl-accepting chemotaxis protein [Spirochaetia bacterium]